MIGKITNYLAVIIGMILLGNCFLKLVFLSENLMQFLFGIVLLSLWSIAAIILIVREILYFAGKK